MNGRDSMPTDKVFPADFQKCVEFHGHVCPGLSIGFRAAQAGMDWLKENRAEDEELVAVVDFLKLLLEIFSKFLLFHR